MVSELKRNQKDHRVQWSIQESLSQLWHYYHYGLTKWADLRVVTVGYEIISLIPKSFKSGGFEEQKM